MNECIIIIRPLSKNIYKAISNVLTLKMIDVVLVGNKDIIKIMLKENNIDISICEIIDLTNYGEIEDVINKLSKKRVIKGIVHDGANIMDYKVTSKYYIINKGSYQKQLYIVSKDYFLQNNILEEINNSPLNRKLGIVAEEKQDYLDFISRNKGKYRYKQLTSKCIYKSKYNVLVFLNNNQMNEYIKEVNDDIKARVIEVKKTSSIQFVDAFMNNFKNCFYSFVYLTKSSFHNTHINSNRA